MGCFYCQRCDRMGDSQDGECVEDPTTPNEMIHESCLTDEEAEVVERESSIDYRKRRDAFVAEMEKEHEE